MGAPVVASEVSEVSSPSTPLALCKLMASQLQLALQTAALELNYERSSRAVKEVLQDEDIRTLRHQLLLLEDDREALLEQLENEEERADSFELDLNDALAHCDELEAEIGRLNDELRTKLREGSTMRVRIAQSIMRLLKLMLLQAELNAMSSSSSEHAKLLTEKLALSRELNNIKPELEHLRTQTNNYQQILSDKLSLERQLNTIQVELENAQRNVQRARDRQRKTGDYDATYEAQLDDLQKQLKEEKAVRREAQRELQLRKSEEESQERPSSRGKGREDDERLKAKLDELRKELSSEKKERQKAEKAAEKEKTAWEAQKSVLDDKIAQFRTKLRSTKEQLKEKEAELEKLKSAASAKPAPAPVAAAKTKPTNPRKRAAAQMDPDPSHLGTPGDGLRAKRGKKVTAARAMPGEKSSFSITPFLNRTMSAPPEGDSDAEQQTNPTVTEEDPDATPTQAKVSAAAKAVPPPKALAPAPSSKMNTNPAPPKRVKRTSAAVPPSLDTIVDASPEKPTSQPTMAPKWKANRPPRKSLLDFSTFNVEPQPVQKKKKQRTLGNTSFIGGNTTTLFDEEDGDAPKAKAIPGKGLFGGRAMTFGKGGFANAKNRLKGPLMLADDGSGFMFSPLKKDKRRMAQERAAIDQTTVVG